MKYLIKYIFTYKINLHFDIKKFLKEFFIRDESGADDDSALWHPYLSEIAVFGLIAALCLTIMFGCLGTLRSDPQTTEDPIYNAMHDDRQPAIQFTEDKRYMLTADPEKVNINTASKAELIELDGIGNTISERILKYRYENGEFNTIYQLLEVDGVSQARFIKLKDKITV